MQAGQERGGRHQECDIRSELENNKQLYQVSTWDEHLSYLHISSISEQGREAPVHIRRPDKAGSITVHRYCHVATRDSVVVVVVNIVIFSCLPDRFQSVCTKSDVM